MSEQPEPRDEARLADRAHTFLRGVEPHGAPEAMDHAIVRGKGLRGFEAGLRIHAVGALVLDIRTLIAASTLVQGRIGEEQRLHTIIPHARVVFNEVPPVRVVKGGLREQGIGRRHVGVQGAHVFQHLARPRHVRAAALGAQNGFERVGAASDEPGKVSQPTWMLRSLGK